MMRTCPKCNAPNLPEAAFCHNCSSPLAPAPSAPPPQQQWQQPIGGAPMMGQAPAAGGGASSKAVTAAVLGVASIFCCGLLAGIPGAILGWMELNAIKMGQSPEAGKWMAQVGLYGGIAGSILSVIGTIIYVLFMLMSMR